MKLEEAIEIKETELEGSVEHSELELSRAEQLSIEALKEVERLRRIVYPDQRTLLQGETKTGGKQ